MASLKSSRRFETAVALALLAAAGSAPAQAPRAANDAAPEVLDRIEAVQSTGGWNAPALIGPLTELSLVYEERGDDQLALALIERATQVLRVNYGLHSLDEAPLLQRRIRIERARGNAEAAWQEEQRLLALVRRHPYDTRTVPILEEIAAYRGSLRERYRSGEFPPEMVLGCYYSYWVRRSPFAERGGCRSGSRGAALAAMEHEEYEYRAEAARVLARRSYWLNTACSRPEPPGAAAARESRRDAKAAAATHLGRLSDYADCIEIKHEVAARADAAPAEIERLLGERTAAERELQQRKAGYEDQFVPIKVRSAALQWLPRR